MAQPKPRDPDPLVEERREPPRPAPTRQRTDRLQESPRSTTRSRPNGIGPKAFRSCAEVLLATSRLSDRRPILRQVLRAHRRGDHYVVITTLMPLVEGILVDAMFRGEAVPDCARAQKAIAKLEQDDPEDALITALGSLIVAGAAGMGLFARSDPTHYACRGEPRTLNRHAILHGFARRYGSRRTRYAWSCS